MNAVARDIERAADAVRAANHSTMRGPLTAPESYAVVGNLAELVRRLPQVVEFVGRSLRRAEPDHHYDDRGLDPVGALFDAQDRLRDVRDHLAALGASVDATHNTLSHLGCRTTED